MEQVERIKNDHYKEEKQLLHLKSPHLWGIFFPTNSERKPCFMLYYWHISSTEKLKHVNFKNKKRKTFSFTLRHCSVFIHHQTMSTLQSRFFNQVIVSVYKIQMEKKKNPTVEAHRCWNQSLAKVQVATVLCLLKIDGLCLFNVVPTKPCRTKIIYT